MKKAIDYIIFGLSALFLVFHVYTALFGVLPGISQRAVHLGILIAIFYLGLLKKEGRFAKLTAPVKVLLMLGGIAGVTYVSLINESLNLRAGIVLPADIVFGILLIISLMVGAWIAVGRSLTIIIGVFIAYAFLGNHLPGLLAHTGMTVGRFINLTVLTTEGIFGSPLYASAGQIALFVILGAIFTETGVGDYFTSVATALFGRMTGGPAKVAVVASGFFGSINGSAIANVIGTGTFTIPLMKKSGFDPEFAGATEAAASTGGQIMPPIMGTTAFLAAEMLGISYFTFAKAALIPAILFYVALIMAVDLYARRHKLKNVNLEDMPSAKKLLKKCYLFSPLLFLVVLMGPFKWTITRAGVYTIVFTILLSFLSKDTRINKERFARIVKSAASGMVPVAIACGAVGVIVAIVQGSGLAYRLSSMLVLVANGSVLILLLLTMVVSIILGMGVPTAAAYLILAVLVAPTLIQLGVSPIAAHLFAFYFGVISNITPPVALAAYAAAGIAKANPNRTGFKAFGLAISGFVLPFMFVYNPNLLFEGDILLVIRGFATATLGVYCLSCAIQGMAHKWQINVFERVLLVAASFLLIDATLITDLIGLAVMAGIIILHAFLGKTDKAAPVQP